MKRKLRITALVLISLIFLSACSSRDLSTLESSLYGHWKDEFNNSTYYRDGDLTDVSKEGEQTRYSYSVLEEDEVNNSIILELRNLETTSGYTKQINFNEDRDEIIETVFLDSFRQYFKQDHGGNTSSREIENSVKKSVNDLFSDMYAGETVSIEMKYIDKNQEP